MGNMPNEAIVDWEIQCTPGVEEALIAFRLLPLHQPGAELTQTERLAIRLPEIERLHATLGRALELIRQTPTLGGAQPH